MRAPCEIRHIDLSRTIEPLALNEGVAGLLAVFWWRQLPLGQRLFDAGELPLPAAVVANVAAQTSCGAVSSHLLDEPQLAERGELLQHTAPLKALDRLLARRARQTTGLKASVVVPTCDRPEALARCLASLAPSRPHIHEIIVVDNGARGGRTRAVAAAAPGVRYVREPRPGGSIARNTGARHASGEVLAFIDDDVVAHEGWVMNLLLEFGDPTIACVTGLILPLELATDAQLTFERQMGFGRGFNFVTYDAAFFRATRRKGVPVWRLGGSGNMAIRRDVFFAVRGFDERLGPGHDAAGCSEDSELWYRLLAAGMACRYTPAAVVHHEHRRDMPSLRRQLHGYMRGHVAALLVQFEKHGHWGNVYRLLLHLPYSYAKQVAARIVRHRRSRATLMPEISGVFSGVLFYAACRLRGRAHGRFSEAAEEEGRARLSA